MIFKFTIFTGMDNKTFVQKLPFPFISRIFR